MSKFLKAFAVAALIPISALALGREAGNDETAAWDTDVRPDGLGLPAGRGDVAIGEEVFVENCASCHGDFGEGVDRWPALVGGVDTLQDARPVRTIGSFWPYLSTVFDYINRAMTVGYGPELTADEIYAITAYILYSNDLVQDNFVLSRENFAATRLPNESGFYMDDRATLELPAFSNAVCMDNCNPGVQVSLRAPKDDGTIDDVAVVAPADPERIAAGKKVFRKCKACHQIGEGAANKTGPALTAVVGAKAGAVEGFRYSKPLAAMATGGLIWNEETLHKFLAKPRTFMPSTKMSFAGLKKQKDREALIAYLKSES